MANTYELIASNTVGSGGVASISFTSIPATYTDLIVKLSTRTNYGAVSAWNNIYYNSSTSGFTGRAMYGDGSSTVSFTAVNGPISVGDGATANTFSNSEVYIPNYLSSQYKSLSADGANENNATEAYVSLTAELWSNTAAITSIQIIPGVGNLKQYSTAYLYGIKNS
jgi:hypothetical protein